MTTKKKLIICSVILGFSIIIEVLFVYHHGHDWWQGLIGFDVIFGFLSCLFLILFSKFLGKKLLQRPEDYYGGGDQRDD